MTASGGDTYTATIPGAAAGHLIRYRVEATNAAAPPLPPHRRHHHLPGRRGRRAASPAPIPVLEWFIADADYNAITANPTADIDRHGRARLQRHGLSTTSQVNIRGQARRPTPKPNWKFEMPQNHDLDMPGVSSSRSTSSPCRPTGATSRTAGRSCPGTPTSAPASSTTQVFPVRTQRNAAFQGLYTYLDLFDGTWRDREGYADNQFFKAGHGAFDATRPLAESGSRRRTPTTTDFAPIAAFLNGVDLTGTAQRNYLLANADIPQMINYAAVTAIVQHVDSSRRTST